MDQLQAKRNSTKPVHFKALAVDEVGVLTESRTISGYAAVFGNKDEAMDILIKGCFAKSIQERGPQSATNRKVIFLWMHDMDEPLGKLTVLKEDEHGLYFEAVLDNIPEADRALEQMKSGTLNQFSIGYQYVWDKIEYDKEADAFIVKEVNLFEISVVSIGCNELTGFSGMKAAQIASERNKVIRDTEKALKGIDQAKQYELRQLISKHIALAEAEPEKPTQQEAEPQKGLFKSIGSKLN